MKRPNGGTGGWQSSVNRHFLNCLSRDETDHDCSFRKSAAIIFHNSEGTINPFPCRPPVTDNVLSLAIHRQASECKYAAGRNQSTGLFARFARAPNWEPAGKSATSPFSGLGRWAGHWKSDAQICMECARPKALSVLEACAPCQGSYLRRPR